MLRIFEVGAVLAACGCLLACKTPPPVTAKALPSPIREAVHERLDPTLLDGSSAREQGKAYRVGPGDSLLVAVYGHPELALASYAGGSVGGGQQGRQGGLVIDNDGSIQFPLIGSVNVEGKTLDELRVFLEEELAKYLKGPEVTVQVLFTGSIRYYLMGQFTSPGLKYSDRPLTLLEAISLGGSITTESASLRTAYLARGNKKLPIDFRKLLLEGDLRYNVPLRSGDVVFVPDNSSERAFVFGGQTGSNTRGGAVSFTGGHLTLLQALASAGFGFRERKQSVLSETRVIRSVGDTATLYLVDAEAIIDGEAAPFDLAPGDVVFVPMTAMTSFNMAIEQLLPTLRVISGTLQPFVQIRYLSE